MTKGFKEDSPLRGLSRSELHAMAELSGQEGQLANHEAAFLQSLLSLHELKVKMRLPTARRYLKCRSR